MYSRQHVNGHKKANKGNFVKSFVYNGYDTLHARVCVKENKGSYACSTRERERERERERVQNYLELPNNLLYFFHFFVLKNQMHRQ